MSPKKLILHHTGVSRSQVAVQFWAVNAYHKKEFNFISSLGYYGGYQYLIEADGSVRQYRAENEEGAHTIGQNNQSIGICLAGNFNEEMPTTAQIDHLRSLLDSLITTYSIPEWEIYPHRSFARKDCPGLLLSDNWARKLLSKPELQKEELLKQDKIILLSSYLDTLKHLLLKLLGLLKRPD